MTEEHDPHPSVRLTDDGELLSLPDPRKHKYLNDRKQVVLGLLVVLSVFVAFIAGAVSITTLYPVPHDSNLEFGGFVRETVIAESTRVIPTPRVALSCSELLSKPGPKVSFVTLSTVDMSKSAMHLASLDGSEVCQLPRGQGAGRMAWSPHSKQVVIACPNRICAMGVDGSNARYIDPQQLGLGVESIDWSPDGLRYAFTRRTQYNSNCNPCSSTVYTMDADGSHMRGLVSTRNMRDSWPRWSPDSKRIVFVSDHEGSSEIYVMNSDGSEITRLTNSGEEKSGPDWSPDGRRITFASYQNGNYDIYVMNLDGSNLHRLTENAARDYNPAWTQDGKFIVFSSYREGYNAIYVMNSDGSDERRLLTFELEGDYPRTLPAQ